MRPWLVLIGVAFLVVAGMSTTSLWLWPSTGSTRSIATEVPPTPSALNQTRSALLTGVNSSDGSFTLDWQSSGTFDVELYQAPGCGTATVACAQGPAIAHWPANQTGRYQSRGALSYPYLLVWTARIGPTDTFQAVAESLSQAPPPEPVWGELATYGSLAALGAVGAIALFLGVFLSGGIYRRGPRDPRGSDEGARRVGDDPLSATDPRRGSLADADAPPPPRPPSPDR